MAIISRSETWHEEGRLIIMNGFGQEDRDDQKRPDLGIESLRILDSLREHKFSARNPRDMETVRSLLARRGCDARVIDGIIWRYRNLAGLC